MALYEYPVGQPEIMSEELMEIVRQQLNEVTRNTDLTKLPMAIVECDVEYQDAGAGGCFPLLSHKQPDGLLVYSFERLHCIKTTIDLAEAVRYNGAIIKRIVHGVIWPDREPIFREMINKMYAIKRDNKRDAPAVANIGKLLMNSSYGKMLQRLVEDNWRIFSLTGGDQYYTSEGYRRPKPAKANVTYDEDYDKAELDQLYRRFRVMEEHTLANGNQALVRVRADPEHKHENHPVHLGAFILAWTKVLMNQCIDSFDGFTSWDGTFYYTDTDSLHVHARALAMMKKKRPDIIGEELGQLHDDIDEVKNGKIIASRFVRPKLYMDEIIGYDLESYKAEDKRAKAAGIAMDLSRVAIVIAYHKRAKGVRPSARARLTMRDCDTMLPPVQAAAAAAAESESRKWPMVAAAPTVSVVGEARWDRAFKDEKKPAIATRRLIKEINRVPWAGRVFDPRTSYFIPITDSTRSDYNSIVDATKQAQAELQSDIIIGRVEAKGWMRSQIVARDSQLRRVLRQIKVAAACEADGIAQQQQDEQQVRRHGLPKLEPDPTLAEPDVTQSNPAGYRQCASYYILGYTRFDAWLNDASLMAMHYAHQRHEESQQYRAALRNALEHCKA
jgi:hypothetical protein